MFVFMKSQSNKIKNTVLVASGKGGVGKTMVAANLAIALAQDGYRVGLLDADLYGPSMPLAFGLAGKQAMARNTGGSEEFIPFESLGVKVMSLGFMMNPEDAVIWRGPMASGMLTKLIDHTSWGELDFLIIDTPPGTGDIAITLAQKLPLSTAIIVITPQQMALADGRKAIRMFQADGINIPVLGVVENMSYFVPEKHPDEKYLLFGSGGGAQLSKEAGVPMLAQIPLVSDVCELTEKGKSAFASSSTIVVEAFHHLAIQVSRKCEAVSDKRKFDFSKVVAPAGK